MLGDSKEAEWVGVAGAGARMPILGVSKEVGGVGGGGDGLPDMAPEIGCTDPKPAGAPRTGPRPPNLEDSGSFTSLS